MESRLALNIHHLTLQYLWEVAELKIVEAVVKSFNTAGSKYTVQFIFTMDLRTSTFELNLLTQFQRDNEAWLVVQL